MFLKIEKTAEEMASDILTEVPSKYQKSVGFWCWDYALAIAKGGLNAI